jgi:hypothetical protein
MRIINTRLLNEFYQVTDVDITSVALLAILEVGMICLNLRNLLTQYCQTINGSFEAATAHKIGLSKMINSYGGIWSLEQNPVVVRCLSWQVRTLRKI